MPMSRKLVLAVALSAIAMLIGLAAAREIRRASELADYSAHAALTQEICNRLDAIPTGEPYPESLAELPLTYPDGGNRELLKRFEYHVTSSGYVLRTKLGRKEIEHSFPR